MPQARLSNDEFFSRLTQLLEHTHQKGHGSVFLSQTRLQPEAGASKTTPSGTLTEDDPLADLHPPAPLPLLVRATDGNSQSIDRKKSKDKVKLSTVVAPDDVEAFFTRYAEVCRASMQNLKKRDRSKRKLRKKNQSKKETDAS